ncbi:MAG TPA: hypothetical protein VMF30_02835, partial [Pirellulales bacterium]|nr:hypothetical protein [Pirellulales bacterium]
AIFFHPPGKTAKPLAAYERAAIEKRMAQIAVAVGHPTRSAEQVAALERERADLQRELADDDARQASCAARGKAQASGAARN